MLVMKPFQTNTREFGSPLVVCLFLSLLSCQGLKAIRLDLSASVVPHMICRNDALNLNHFTILSMPFYSGELNFTAMGSEWWWQKPLRERAMDSSNGEIESRWVYQRKNNFFTGYLSCLNLRQFRAIQMVTSR